MLTESAVRELEGVKQQLISERLAIREQLHDIDAKIHAIDTLIGPTSTEPVGLGKPPTRETTPHESLALTTPATQQRLGSVRN